MKRTSFVTLIVSLVCFYVASSQATLRAESLFGITDLNQLLVINSVTRQVTSVKNITGLGSGESLIGIDVRPATGQLYGYSDADRFYTINPGTGVSAAIGAALGLIDTVQSFDFDPVNDQIRLLTNFRKNIRINPNTAGVISNDSMLTFAGGDPNSGQAPIIVHGAYTNSFPGAPSTTLYDLDSTTNSLTIQAPENNGTLSTVGPTGMTLDSFGASNGMDISGLTGIGYVVGTSFAGSGLTENTLYTINLATGQLTASGPITGLPAAPMALVATSEDGLGLYSTDGGHGSHPHDDPAVIIDVAAPIGVPEPSTFVLAGCGAVALVGLARRRAVRKN